MRTLSTILIGCLLSFLFAGKLSAQWVQTNGPFLGGVESFAVCPNGKGGTNLFATIGGVVFLSTNSGINWTAINNGLPKWPYDTTVYPVSTIVGIDTNLFAGTMSRGVFRSTNNGTTWTAVNDGLPKAASETTLNLDVNTFAVIGANLFAGTSAGVFLSTNNGANWSSVDSILTNTSVNTLAVSGTNLFAGTSAGVFLSTNDGTNWSAVDSGLTNSAVVALAVSPNGAGGTNLFASTGFPMGAPSRAAIYVSTDDGKSWTTLSTPFSFFTSMVQIDANVFVGTDGGVFISTNNGMNWTLTGNTLGWVNTLTVSGPNLFAGTDCGGFVSADKGANWTMIMTGYDPGVQVTTLAGRGTELFAGVATAYWCRSAEHVSGSRWKSVTRIGSPRYVSYIFHSTDNGDSWVEQMADYANCFAFEGDNVFVGTSDGVYLSTNNGTKWTQTGLPNTAVNTLAVPGTNLFAGTGSGVFLSTNDGTSWIATDSGLTNTSVNTLAVSGTNLFAGTASGVFLSTNDGTSWIAIDSGLTNTSVNTLVASGTNLFAGTDGGVFLSTNDGTTWMQTGATGVNALSVSGTNLFARIGSDVFLSTNDGTSWRSVNYKSHYDTTYSDVCTMYVNDAYVFLGTVLSDGVCWQAGEGIWRRPLSEMIASVHPSSSVLPKEFKLSQNYPNPFNPSTTICYQLPTQGHVTLKVFDVLGREVATLVNGEQTAGYKSVTWDAGNLSSGVYCFRLQAGTFIETKKLLLLR